jgi:hypothetical protein
MFQKSFQIYYKFNIKYLYVLEYTGLSIYRWSIITFLMTRFFFKRKCPSFIDKHKPREIRNLFWSPLFSKLQKWHFAETYGNYGTFV